MFFLVVDHVSDIRVPNWAADTLKFGHHDGEIRAMTPMPAELSTVQPVPEAAPATWPWLHRYGSVPAHLAYPQVTLYEAVADTARRVPDAVAWDFFDTTATYREFLASIDSCAGALAALGLKAGERIVVALPTSPQAIIAFYAANRLGAVPAFVHPLSTAPEIERCLDATGARFALTLDAFYDRFASVRPRVPLEVIVLARIPDYLSMAKRLGFGLTKGRRIPAVPADPRVRWWAALMRGPHPAVPRAPATTHDPAAILFSGGTSGAPKGIVLSHQNFIALAVQVAAWGNVADGDTFLAILPVFHGFGLGAVNVMLMTGGKSILVPTFTARSAAVLLRRKRPNLPMLYEALTRDRSLATADLSCLRATFCGADRTSSATSPGCSPEPPGRDHRGRARSRRRPHPNRASMRRPRASPRPSGRFSSSAARRWRSHPTRHSLPMQCRGSGCRSICPAWRAACSGAITRCRCIISAGRRCARRTAFCSPACRAISGSTTAGTCAAPAP
jgi:acyl-CoA synthetase (AMP-forming)/AMP-acid ligase II